MRSSTDVGDEATPEEESSAVALDATGGCGEVRPGEEARSQGLVLEEAEATVGGGTMGSRAGDEAASDASSDSDGGEEVASDAVCEAVS